MKYTSVTGFVFLDKPLKDEEKEMLQNFGATVTTLQVEETGDDAPTFVSFRHSGVCDNIFSVLKAFGDRTFLGTLILGGENGEKEWCFFDTEWKKKPYPDGHQEMRLEGYGRSSIYGLYG